MATRIPFTESQWEELENQALVFKYLAAGVQVPPHLLFLIKRPFLFSSSHSSSSSSSSPSTFFSPTLSPHFGWNVYEMGMGRKIDSEPGRCRRTDGKKWRCSKEAYPDSKYCERHMHRGKNRSSSRKPLPLPHPPQFSDSSTTNLFLDSSLVSSRVRRRSRYMDDFISLEPSGSIKSFSSSPMVNNIKGEKQPDRHCFILGADLGTRERPLLLEEEVKRRDDEEEEEEEEEEEQRSKRVYRFLDEWPSSKSSSVSTSLFI
ncbi:Growth-regulating factor 6 [Cardamine amara subsp. amara]|uniref:Growth-regulating factor n=1 Tax=Cardamine amara subsp. amara TaxID=228776 RepID=A0ABD1ASP9_CARAN